MNDLNNVNNENQTVSSPITPPVSSGVYNPGVKLPQGPVVTKKSYPVDNKDFYFFVFVSVASFIFIRLGVLNAFNLGLTVTYSVLSLGILIYVSSKDSKNKAFYSLMFIIDLILAVSFSLHDNSFIKFLTVLVLFFTTAMTLNGANGTHLCNDGTFLKLADVLYVGGIEPLINLNALFSSIKSVFKSKNNKFFMAIAGALIAVPVLVVVIPLLSSADVAFNTIVKKVFSDVFMLVVSLVITVLITPFITSYGFSLSKGITKEKNKSFNSKSGKVSPVFLNTFLCVIASIYVVFLVSQLAYITDTFAFLLPEEFSAAEFARSGFFQMGAIALINLIITFLVSVIEKPKDNGKLPVSTKLILTFFMLFSLFLTVNAFIRMKMYIDMYGLTQLRVLTSIFMIMLCVIFLFVLIRIFNEKFKYINFVILTCALTFVLVSVSDLDSVISKYNYQKYAQGEIGVDFEHYETLGNAAVPELVKLAESEDFIIKNLAKESLVNIALDEFDYYYDDYESGQFEEFKYDSNIFKYNRSQQTAGKEFEKFFKSKPGIVYLDKSLSDYSFKVEEYGAENFMPDFNNFNLEFYSPEFYYSENTDAEDKSKMLELTLYYYDYNFEDAKKLINQSFKFGKSFQYGDDQYFIVESKDFTSPTEIAVVNINEYEQTISYVWIYNENATNEDVKDIETYVTEHFASDFSGWY